MQNNNEGMIPTSLPPVRPSWSQVGDFGAAGRQLALADIWMALWKRRVAVVLLATGVLVIFALYVFLKKPVYESMAQIRVDSSQQGGLGLEDLVSQRFSDSDAEGGRLQTEATILQSQTVSMQVIKNLDLGHKADFAGKKLAARISSGDPAKMSPKEREELLKAFADSERIEVIPKTRIIEIRFRSTDPALATAAVNGIVDAYIQRNFQTKYEGTQQVSEWLSKQMEDLKADAARAQQKLADFQKENNVIGADENNNIVTDRLRHLNTQVADAEADRIVKEARFRLASSGNPELIAAVVPSTALQVLRTQEADLKAQYSQLDSKYGSNYPKVRELQAQLKRLNNSISDEINNVGQRLHDEYLAASNTEGGLRKQFEEQKQEAFKLNASAVQFATLKHEVESSQELCDTLQLKLKEAGLMAGLASADISIVDRGMIPARPALPKKTLTLSLGLLVGLFGGIVLAFVLESVDDSLETMEEVEAASSLPALAAVPLLESKYLSRHFRHSRPLPSMATAAIYPGTLLAEAYQVICNSLLLSSPDRPPKVLVVTSALPGEGKSTTSCNLAITLAQRGGRVLLVDTDLRRSTLPFQLGVEESKTAGLSSILAGGDETEAVRKPFAEFPNFDLILAGPQSPCPTQLLMSNKMKSLLEKWSTEYDHVVVDTTPVLYVADSLPLAAKADGVLLVVRSGRSRKKAFKRMCDMLYRAKANVVGVVVNGVDLQLEPYAHNYYGRLQGDRNEAN